MQSRCLFLTALTTLLLVASPAFAQEAKYHGGSYDGYDRSITNEVTIGGGGQIQSFTVDGRNNVIGSDVNSKAVFVQLTSEGTYVFTLTASDFKENPNTTPQRHVVVHSNSDSGDRRTLTLNGVGDSDTLFSPVPLFLLFVDDEPADNRGSSTVEVHKIGETPTSYTVDAVNNVIGSSLTSQGVAVPIASSGIYVFTLTASDFKENPNTTPQRHVVVYGSNLGDNRTFTLNGVGSSDTLSVPAPMTMYLFFIDSNPGDNVGSSTVEVRKIGELVTVSLPDTSARPRVSADTLYIPVTVSSLDGQGVLSADFTVSFADTVLNPLGVSVAGTIAESADTTIANTTVPGKISVSIASPTPLAGSGTLINLYFEVIGQAGDSTGLIFDFFEFNDGIPSVETSDGFLEIIGFEISGTITYFSPAAPKMDSVQVVLSGTDAFGGTVEETTYTDLEGDYLFANLNPSGGNTYTLTPSRALPGYPADMSIISSLDAVFVLLHSVGLDTLEGDYFVAGEVSDNDRVSGYDGALILQQVIGLPDVNPFPIAGDDPGKDFIFRSAAVEAGDFSTTSITLTSLAADSTGNDFVGVAYGDVTGSWTQNPGVTRPVAGVGRVVRLAGLGSDNRFAVLIDDARGIYSGYVELEIAPPCWQVVGVKCGDLTTDTELVYTVRDGRLVIAFAGVEVLQGSGSLVEIQLQARSDQAMPIRLTQVQFDEGRIPVVIDPVISRSQGMPVAYRLEQNVPNPFNPATEIGYALPEAGHVRLVIYNLLGQEVRVLVDEEQSAGFHSVVWDGRDSRGRSVGSSVYLYRLTAGAFSQTRRMLLLK